MQLYGYGEDALTIYALQNRIESILSKLADNSDPHNRKMIYRPSFGRGRGGSFGEFDFLIATPKTIYLGESKWIGSKELRKRAREIILDETQIKRHQTFEKYRSEWVHCKALYMRESDSPFKWSDFLGSVATRNALDDLVLPQSGSKLAANIMTYMDMIDESQGGTAGEVRHVILFIEAGFQYDELSVPPSFEFVHIDCSKDSVNDLVCLGM